MMRHGTCLGTWRHFNEYYDSELDARRQRRVRDHLASCRRCRHAYDRFAATIADLSLLAKGSLLPDRSVSTERDRREPETGAPPVRENLRAAIARRITVMGPEPDTDR